MSTLWFPLMYHVHEHIEQGNPDDPILPDDSPHRGRLKIDSTLAADSMEDDDVVFVKEEKNNPVEHEVQVKHEDPVEREDPVEHEAPIKQEDPVEHEVQVEGRRKAKPTRWPGWYHRPWTWGQWTLVDVPFEGGTRSLYLYHKEGCIPIHIGEDLEFRRIDLGDDSRPLHWETYSYFDSKVMSMTSIYRALVPVAPDHSEWREVPIKLQCQLVRTTDYERRLFGEPDMDVTIFSGDTEHYDDDDNSVYGKTLFSMKQHKDAVRAIITGTSTTPLDRAVRWEVLSTSGAGAYVSDCLGVAIRRVAWASHGKVDDTYLIVTALPNHVPDTQKVERLTFKEPSKAVAFVCWAASMVYNITFAGFAFSRDVQMADFVYENTTNQLKIVRNDLLVFATGLPRGARASRIRLVLLQFIDFGSSRIIYSRPARTHDLGVFPVNYIELLTGFRSRVADGRNTREIMEAIMAFDGAVEENYGMVRQDWAI